MIFVALCLFLIIQFQCYAIKEIVPGDTASSLNLLFQGNADISYYDITTGSICSLPLEKIDHYYLPLYKKDIAIVNIPNDYIISQAYRIDYYLNPTITNNPNLLHTNYVLDCKGEDPYMCSPKTSKSMLCIFGLRMSTHSVVSLISQILIDFGFLVEFSYILNSQDELVTLFHANNINTIFNDFISNGNSMSFAVNSFYMKVEIRNDNKLTLSIRTISNIGVTSELISISHRVYNSTLNKMHFKLEYNQQEIEECFTSNNIIIKRIGDYTTYFLKVSINHQVIACLCLDLMAIVTSNNLNISFIGQSKVNLLMLSSLFTESYDTHCLISNKAIQCGVNSLGLGTKAISVQNISQYNRETISFLYSCNNSYFQFCKTTDGLISIDSSYNLGFNACHYTVTYNTNNLKELYIKNNHITLALNKIYPIQLPQVFSPNSLYNLCVYSKALLLNIGYCSCQICIKTIEITSTYHQINKCYSKYNHRCNCFDQSLVTPLSPYKFSSLSFNLCTECYINVNCSHNNKNSKCQNILKTGITSIIKNDRTIISSSSKYLNENIVYGLCDCGVISSYNSLNSILNSYTVYYDKNSPIVLSQSMIACIECLYETFTINTSSTCMRNCALFQINNIEAYHVPFGGFQCTSCVFSSEFLQVIKIIEPSHFFKLEECIVKYPETFYSDCMLVIKALKYPSNQIFSGLVTHFRVECPGRPFQTKGSVCVPWYGFNDISFFTLIYKKTVNKVQWEDIYQCLNDQCEASTKTDCLANPISCVCYDSCPISKGKYFHNIPIPCSGNGVCTNQFKCICDPGFIEPTCEIHCDDTLGGCCIDDNDCLHNVSLNKCKKNSIGNVGYCDS